MLPSPPNRMLGEERESGEEREGGREVRKEGKKEGRKEREVGEGRKEREGGREVFNKRCHTTDESSHSHSDRVVADLNQIDNCIVKPSHRLRVFKPLGK